jgi:hypothetical protein
MLCLHSQTCTDNISIYLLACYIYHVGSRVLTYLNEQWLKYFDVYTHCWQRLGKHIPSGANATNNRTSVARKRISKHA